MGNKMMFKGRFEDEHEREREREKQERARKEAEREALEELRREAAKRKRREDEEKSGELAMLDGISKEIAHVTNEVNRLLARGEAASKEADKCGIYQEALVLSHRFFEKLPTQAIIGHYKAISERASIEAGHSTRGKGAVEFIRNDSDSFKKFLEVEAELLKKSGMEEGIVDGLMRKIEKKIDAFVRDPVDAVGLEVAIEQLKCYLRERIEGISQDMSVESLRGVLVQTLGGLSMIIVDIVAHENLGDMVAGASIALGANLVQSGLK